MCTQSVRYILQITRVRHATVQHSTAQHSVCLHSNLSNMLKDSIEILMRRNDRSAFRFDSAWEALTRPIAGAHSHSRTIMDLGLGLSWPGLVSSAHGGWTVGARFGAWKPTLPTWSSCTDVLVVTWCWVLLFNLLIIEQTLMHILLLSPAGSWSCTGFATESKI